MLSFHLLIGDKRLTRDNVDNSSTLETYFQKLTHYEPIGITPQKTRSLLSKFTMISIRNPSIIFDQILNIPTKLNCGLHDYYRIHCHHTHHHLHQDHDQHRLHQDHDGGGQGKAGGLSLPISFSLTRAPLNHIFTCTWSYYDLSYYDIWHNHGQF